MVELAGFRMPNVDNEADPADMGNAEVGVGEEQSTPQAEAPEAGAGQAASPEEQAKLDTFVKQAHMLLYSPKNRDILKSLAKVLKESPPVEGLATASAHVFLRVFSTTRDSGAPPNADVLLNAGAGIVNDIADLSKRAEIKEYSPKEIEGAMFRATDMVRASLQKQGIIKTEDAQKDLSILKSASDAGTLDQTLPGIDEAIKKITVDSAPPSVPKPVMPKAPQMPSAAGGF